MALISEKLQLSVGEPKMQIFFHVGAKVDIFEKSRQIKEPLEISKITRFKAPWFFPRVKSRFQ